VSRGEPTMCLAEELNGQTIGRWVRFHWCFPISDVHAVITGELREVHHNAGLDVVVSLAGPDSVGDKTEFVVARGCPVEVLVVDGGA